MMRGAFLLTLAFLFGPISAQAQAGPPAGCDGPEYRAFDFWLGEWSVTNPQGQTVGSNIIRSVSGGCALLESWTDARGMTGTSINYHDPRTGKWTQVWVGQGGSILHLEGGLEDGSMVLGGERPGPDGTTIRDRIRWTPLDDGSVRQHWQASRDGGTTWQTVFDGNYGKEG